MRIGIDIGGTDTKIGLVDAHQKLIDTLTIPTGTGRNEEEIIGDIGRAALSLLERNEIPVDQCTGVGIGVPGTVDRKTGTVVYANNMQWENVPLVREIGRYLPLPVAAANDADCAVLGEAAAGAAKGYGNVVMLTLGTGVGGGVVLDGRLFDGRLAGGTELGHMVVCEGGEMCTCGRKGCLEAYASATALVRDAKRAMEKDKESLLWKLCGGDEERVTAKMVFDAAEQGDLPASRITDSYVEHLSTGIVNIVNIFRPEVFLLGGGVAAQGRKLTDRINRNLEKYCYAGNRGGIPEVRTAELGNRAGMIGAANLL